MGKGKRILWCTLSAWGCGLLGSAVGSYGSWHGRLEQCQRTLPAIAFSQTFCEAWNTPKAIWQGSTTGLGTGLVLGAFFGGLATRSPKQNQGKNSD